MSEAISRRVPFAARYEQQGIDTAEILAITGDRHGRVTLVHWSKTLFSGSNSTAVREEECNDPTIAPSVIEGKTTVPVTCASTTEHLRVCK